MILHLSAVVDRINEKQQNEVYAAHLAEHAQYVAQMKQFSVSVETLDGILAGLSESSQISEESLMDFFAKIADVILSIGNTFKTLVLKGGNRSELRYFYESNMVNIGRVEAKTLDDLKDIQIDYPTGMQGTYKNALDVIDEVYAAVNMAAMIANGSDLMDRVLASMSRGSNSHESEVESALRQLEPSVRRQDQAMTALNKVFKENGQPLAKKSFASLFTSVAELKNVRVGLLNLEKTLLSCATIRKSMEEMAKSVDLAVGLIKDSVEGELGDDPNIKFAYVPSQKFVQTLASYIRLQALALTNFSDAVNAHMATEHNLGLAYTTLIKA